MKRPAKRTIEALVIGASAGGIDALLALLKGLPRAAPYPVIIVVHLPEERESRLAEVFGEHLGRRVLQAEDKAMALDSSIYFAPPGYHLSIERDRSFSLSQEDPVNFSRPSIDVLMQSAADAYGPSLCGMLLTGASADGAAGLAAIGAAGGLTLVQDPLDAEIPTMPAAAIRLRQPDMILPLRELSTLLATLENL
ncbi:MAG: chemotaxis protein CheB [Pseudomonadota bacterium]